MKQELKVTLIMRTLTLLQDLKLIYFFFFTKDDTYIYLLKTCILI